MLKSQNAVEFKLQRRRLLLKRLSKESKLVSEESMKVLAEFEQLKPLTISRKSSKW